MQSFQIVTPISSLIEQLFPNGAFQVPAINSQPPADEVGLLYLLNVSKEIEFAMNHL